MREIIFNLKMKFQRFKKGYCDLDVWNINTFIEEKLLAIFKEYRGNNIGYPLGATQEEWENIIDRIIYLLTEMNEDTCSQKVTNNDYETIAKYRNECKNELYDLLKEWHWDLWD